MVSIENVIVHEKTTPPVHVILCHHQGAKLSLVHILTCCHWLHIYMYVYMIQTCMRMLVCHCQPIVVFFCAA